LNILPAAFVNIAPNSLLTGQPNTLIPFHSWPHTARSYMLTPFQVRNISPVIPHLLRIYVWVRKPQANRFATLPWKGQGQNILHAHVYRRMCSDQTTGLTTEEWWFDSRQEQPIFCTATRPHRLSPGVKWPGCEADH
jgi:hypothetical protein